MEFFGLDIGDRSIKLVQLKQEHDQLVLWQLGETISPQPGMRGKTAKEWSEVAVAVRNLVRELKLKTKNVVVALPESEVISRLIRFPSMKEREVKSALEFEAETFIPHPLDKIQMDYEIVARDQNGQMLVFVVAVLKETINKYLQMIKEAGLTPLALETPAVALVRIFAQLAKPTLIIDLEGQFTNLIVGKQGNVYLTRTIPIGTESFARAISSSLGLEENVAESYRRAYGLSNQELEGRVRSAMMPLFNRLMDEVRRAFFSFKEDWHDEVGLLILSGDGASTPEFSEEMAKLLGLEVQVAQPFSQVRIVNPPVIDLQKEGSRFSVAFGLASRGFSLNSAQNEATED